MKNDFIFLTQTIYKRLNSTSYKEQGFAISIILTVKQKNKLCLFLFSVQCKRFRQKQFNLFGFQTIFCQLFFPNFHLNEKQMVSPMRIFNVFISTEDFFLLCFSHCHHHHHCHQARERSLFVINVRWENKLKKKKTEIYSLRNFIVL